MARFISKQKYAFHNGVSEFTLPVGGEGTEVPAWVQENFLFKMALKGGVIFELAEVKKATVKAEPEAKVEAKQPEKEPEAEAKAETKAEAKAEAKQPEKKAEAKQPEKKAGK